MISVVILTKDEARDFPTCLASLAWCDDIHVLDSGSTDDTCMLAEKAGARFHSHRFESFGRQRNWALDCCDCRYGWILFLDADEVATPEFVAAMQEAIALAKNETAGYYCCCKLMWQGCWLRRSDSYPKWQFRLARRGRVRFGDFGHGQRESDVQGRLEYIREPYLHFAFSKGLSHWTERHNRYSDLEARARLDERLKWVDLLSRHGSVRNKALKLLLTDLPGWPLLRFTWAYGLRLGFLDGGPGFTYCALLAWYEFLIKVKMRERRLMTAHSHGA